MSPSPPANPPAAILPAAGRALAATASMAEAGQRVDAFLAASLADLSRTRIADLVREGRLLAAGAVIADPSYRVKPGERFLLTVPAPVAAEPLSQDLPLDILFEDAHLLVLVKPAGQVVHPAPGHHDGTLVNALIHHCGDSLSGIGGVKRPGIVHRIDRDVSGVLVIAKHDKAHIGLAAQFTVHSVGRVYEAIVRGLPGSMAGTVDAPLGRHPVDRKRMAIVRHGGKRAVTHWRTLAAAGTRGARLEVRLETGRTHQIRVHLASLGHPILGDRVYGKGGPPPGSPLAAFLADYGRIALHARELAFDHPMTGERLAFTAPPPASFDHLMRLMQAPPPIC
jgi:23S rRNA pseudouridine1911/1915/1917 synthase